uniref:Uncharacterized protein n=1 Tax=Rhizophora mucronata TaxID=61149 RepID=A0A2P2PU97_RHIMU
MVNTDQRAARHYRKMLVMEQKCSGTGRI